jgi:ribokinase
MQDGKQTDGRAGDSLDGRSMRDGQSHASPGSRGRVVVVGSANMDMVVDVDRFPIPGETVFGRSFAMHPGGKGANQAVAAARLGSEVLFIGKMGADVFAERLSASMNGQGVNLDHLLVDDALPTGTALIMVDGKAQNEIIVVSGSNMALTPADMESHREAFATAKVVLFQLEIPVGTVLRGAQIARSYGAVVILNPAPAADLPDELFGLIDYITPNETEATAMTGLSVNDVETAEAAGKILLERGVRNALLTLGEKGALLVSADGARHFPAFIVDAVDTTAAGDAFNGALAHYLTQGLAAAEAILKANSVAALAVQKQGAQPSMPTSEEVKRFVRQMGASASPAGPVYGDGSDGVPIS